MYGTAILNPTNTDIPNSGDILQHHLGWLAFRNNPWFFPIGMFNSLTYPNPISIIYTDSIPLLAVFFKILSPLLPVNFQYWGIWGLLCLVLQAYFGAKIICCFSDDRIIIFCGTIFLILSPILIYRLYGHESLAAHWIILAALYLFFRELTGKAYNFRKECLIWLLLGGLTVSIHLYFLPMVGLILGANVFYKIFFTKNIKSISLIGTYCISAILTIALLGGFSHYGASYNGKGISLFSFNLNGFINPITTNISGVANSLHSSRFFPSLPHEEWQYEGFSYIGAGMILLSMLSMVFVIFDCFRKKKKKTHFSNKIIVTILLFITSVLIALSPRIQLGNSCIIDYQTIIPTFILDFWGIFRSTGRFIWIAYYIIFIGNIFIISKYTKGGFKYAILIVSVVIQLIDFSDFFLQRKMVNEQDLFTLHEKNASQNIFSSKQYKHIIIDSNSNFTDKDYYTIAALAIQNNLTLNYFWLVHNTNEIEPIIDFQEDCIYVFNKDFIRSHEQEYPLRFYEYENYVWGIVEYPNNLFR
ncbi:MAG: hypothetical protein IKQ46_01225 [Bacteroidales bacterium]|nr:hypothetical protein [Bacteroidales bacterium]